jgi:hypothetical protein
MDQTKKCGLCDKDLPLCEYSLNRAARSGLQAYCKSCSREVGRTYRNQNRERWANRDPREAPGEDS